MATDKPTDELATLRSDAPEVDNGGCVSWCYVDGHNVRVVATYRPIPEWDEDKRRAVRDAIEAALVRADDDIQAITREDAPEYVDIGRGDACPEHYEAVEVGRG